MGVNAVEDGQAANVRLLLRPAREFAVTVTDGTGNAVEGAWVGAYADYAIVGDATTDAAGRATLRMPADAPPMAVIAMKPGIGLDYFVFWRKGQTRSDPYRLEPDYAGPLSFVLNGATAVSCDRSAGTMAAMNNVRLTFQEQRCKKVTLLTARQGAIKPATDFD